MQLYLDVVVLDIYAKKLVKDKHWKVIDVNGMLSLLLAS